MYDAQVIVVDGSDNQFNSEIVLNLPSHIRYYHARLPLGDRILYASTLISTEFAMLCADDEFMLVDGLDSCLSFLKANPDYSQCGGASIAIKKIGNNLSLYPSKSKQLKHHLSDPSPSVRLLQHLQGYTPSTSYALHRSSSLISCINECHTFAHASPYMGELMFELVAAINGKSCTLNSVTWIRNHINPMISTPGFDRTQCLRQYLHLQTRKKSVKLFVSKLHFFLERRSPSDSVILSEEKIGQILLEKYPKEARVSILNSFSSGFRRYLSAMAICLRDVSLHFFSAYLHSLPRMFKFRSYWLAKNQYCFHPLRRVGFLEFCDEDLSFVCSLVASSVR